MHPVGRQTAAIAAHLNSLTLAMRSKAVCSCSSSPERWLLGPSPKPALRSLCTAAPTPLSRCTERAAAPTTVCGCPSLACKATVYSNLCAQQAGRPSHLLSSSQPPEGGVYSSQGPAACLCNLDLWQAPHLHVRYLAAYQGHIERRAERFTNACITGGSRKRSWWQAGLC